MTYPIADEAWRTVQTIADAAAVRGASPAAVVKIRMLAAVWVALVVAEETARTEVTQ